MSIPVIAFFNNKGRVGKTSLVYHLAWMYAELRLTTLVADLDPQPNLTCEFLDDERRLQVWPGAEHTQTIFSCLDPLLQRKGDITDPYVDDVIYNSELHIENILLGPGPSIFKEPLGLLLGDLRLGMAEEPLAEAWLKTLEGDEHAFRLTSAFWRMLQKAARAHEASLILLDLGPNFTAINRAALLAADHVIVPVFPDQLSLEALRLLGPMLRQWRNEWQKRLPKNPVADLSLPPGNMQPMGYILSKQPFYVFLSPAAYVNWPGYMPGTFHRFVLDEPDCPDMPMVEDPACLTYLQFYYGMMTAAQRARKPIFNLSTADGIMGHAVKNTVEIYGAYKELAEKIAQRAQVELPARW